MRNAKHTELRDLGWKWGLRYNGRWKAITVSVHDAANWVRERVGEVVDLQTGEIVEDTRERD